MTDTPTRLGPCPTCGHQRINYAVCTCSHLVYVHKLGTKAGKWVRTECYVMTDAGPCPCRLFTPKEA